MANCINYADEFKTEMERDPGVAEIMNFADKLEGNVRKCGRTRVWRHNMPRRRYRLGTRKYSRRQNGDRILATQYEGRVIEDTGLIKMDFLGLKTLSIIRDAVANIKQSHGIDVDIDNIPIDDPKTYELYSSRGATVGTFQFESPGMQRYLRELQPSVFEDLIAMNALYRPGLWKNSRFHRAQTRPRAYRVRHPRNGSLPQGYLRHHCVSGTGYAPVAPAGRVYTRPERHPAQSQWVKKLESRR